MAAIVFLVWLEHSLIQYPQVAGDGLEETCLRMEVPAKCQERQRARLLLELELEQATREQSGSSWGVTLWAALQQWPLWATAAVLGLLLVLCFLLRKRSRQPESRGQEIYSSSNVDETANDKGNNAMAKKVLKISPDTQT